MTGAPPPTTKKKCPLFTIGESLFFSVLAGGLEAKLRVLGCLELLNFKDHVIFSKFIETFMRKFYKVSLYFLKFHKISSVGFKEFVRCKSKVVP